MIATILLTAALTCPHAHGTHSTGAGHTGAHDATQDEHAHPQWERPARSTEPVFVGSGKHRYRWDSDWAKLPAGREWLGSTHGCIVVDKSDRVYVSAETGPAVLVFAPDGTLENSFGADWGGGLHGLSIAQEQVAAPSASNPPREVLYLAHTNRQEVLKTTLSGEVLLRIAAPPAASDLYPNPADYKPTSVAVAADGTIFITDGYGLSWIHRYDKAGTYLNSFGGRGDNPSNLQTPHGLWLARDSNSFSLIVADRENHRLVRFTLKGEFVEATDPSSGLLRRPCHVQFLGELGIVSDLAGRTTLINSQLQLITHLGDNPLAEQRANYNVAPKDWKEGRFTAPHCANFNSKGEIFVMGWNLAGRLTRLLPAPE